MKPTIIIVVALVIVSTLVVVYNNEDEVIINEPLPVVTELTPLEKRVEAIMQSEEFQVEIETLATARAMFEMSIEKQQEALQLSEQAKQTYDLAQSLEGDWHDRHRGE